MDDIMLTLREQLRDPIYKKWFSTPPREVASAALSPPWWVYVQKKPGGRWRRAEFASWKQGYQYVAANIKKYHDMALVHKRQEFRPPVVRDGGKRRYHFPLAQLSYGHHWCGYCRRLTRFAYFRKHHALPKWANSGERRCCICGIRLAAIKRYG